MWYKQWKNWTIAVLVIILIVGGVFLLKRRPASGETAKVEKKTEEPKTEAKKTEELKTEIKKTEAEPKAEAKAEAEEPAAPPVKPATPRKTVRPKVRVAPPESIPPEVIEEKTADRLHEEDLVRAMFNMNTPVASRANAAQELSKYQYYRVARALSFLVQRDRVPQLRAVAATSMGDVANSSFLELLENSATKDPDPGVRLAAKEAVAKISARVEAGQDF